MGRIGVRTINDSRNVSNVSQPPGCGNRRMMLTRTESKNRIAGIPHYGMLLRLIFGSFVGPVFLGFFSFTFLVFVPPELPPIINDAADTKTAIPIAPPIIYQIKLLIPDSIEGIKPFCPARATTIV